MLCANGNACDPCRCERSLSHGMPMRRALRPALASVAVLYAALACIPPTDVQNGERMHRYRGAPRSLASGVSRADSLRLGVGRAGLMAGGPVAGEGESLVLVSSARLLDPSALCGIAGWILPRGIQLLPTFAESLFTHSSYTADPVVEAYNHIPRQPSCGPVVSALPSGNASANALYTSWYPYENPELVQTEPIIVRFDTAVTRVSVYGVGAFKCWTGQYGKLTALDSAGHVVSLAPMQMREPDDCAEDSITYGGYGTVAAASPTIRQLVIEAPQPPSWDVWIEGTNYGLGYVTADYILILSPEPGVPSEPLPTVEIVSAGGPNPGGSFITRATDRLENVITLRARVTPVAFADSVTWEVTGIPLHGAFNTIAPDTVPRGAATSFVLPRSNRSQARWPVAGRVRHDPLTDAQKASDLTKKALGFRITAKVTVNGQTVRSQPVVVQQDEIDTIREEYVEFGQQRVIDRAEFGTLGDPLRNLTADYKLWPSGPRLVVKMPKMQELAVRRFGRPITVMSGYRNPVHHFLHALARSPESQHLYGNATDWVITDPRERPSGLSREEWFTRLWEMTRHPSVDGCWEPAAAIVESSNLDPALRSLNHAHSDWREMTECASAWRLR